MQDGEVGCGAEISDEAALDAHQIPVVSTSLGHEGLDVISGVHLMVADDREEFARACCRLLTDVPLRRLRVVRQELFVGRIRPKITALGERVAGSGLTGRGLKHLVAGRRAD